MYYTLEHRTDKEAGGVFPQVYCLTQFDAHRLVHGEFPTFKPELKFELDKKAIITDILSQAAISADGLLVSPQLKEILDGFHLMNHQYLPALVNGSKGQHQYYWLHLADTKLLDFIDYSSSAFYRTEYGYREEDIELSSFDDYKSKKALYGNMGTIESEHLKLKENFPSQLDLFVFPLFDQNIYISERLMLSMTNKSLKGFEIKFASNRVQINSA